MVQENFFLTLSPAFTVFWLGVNSLHCWVRGYFIGILIYISLMINTTGLFFFSPLCWPCVCLTLTNVYSAPLKCVIWSFLFHSLHSLHVLEIIYFLNKKLANIFSHSVCHIFTPFWLLPLLWKISVQAILNYFYVQVGSYPTNICSGKWPKAFFSIFFQ